MYLTEYGHLIVDEFGAVLRKKRKRILVITDSGKNEVPIKSVRDVIISGKASISSELLKDLCESGVGVLLTSPTGKPVARVVAAKLGGTAENRIEQYKSFEDERAVEIAKNLIAGKIRNQISNLRYYSKSRRMNERVASELYDLAMKLKEKLEEFQSEDFDSIENARGRILAYEGETANTYWDGMKLVLSKWNFTGREQKGSDAVNVCLNVCYNLLSGQIWKYVLMFGLDPFLGYIHVERAGRLSLIYDLMEPFRPMVDRFVVSFLRSLTPAYFSEEAKSKTIAMLRQQFFDGFMQSRLDYRGKKMRMESVMFYFVQSLVSHIKRSGGLVVPYMPW